ncbi:MAG: hypothetical protein OSA97_13175 [Nevskia sp.]|nr:hypothetical protein [Nevskia sp.]
MATVQTGDRVRVVNIPESLLRDLPEEDRIRLKAQRGEIVTVLELMPHGYLWLSFADGTEGFSLLPSDIEFVAN